MLRGLPRALAGLALALLVATPASAHDDGLEAQRDHLAPGEALRVDLVVGEIDGEPAWSREIPSATDLIVDTWAIERPIPSGASSVFQVDHHGANTYSLVELSAAG